jgi:uncharacterized membrane protein
MIRLFTRPVPLVLLLAFCTFIPVMMALVRTIQIPAGTWPEDSGRMAVAPIAWFLHALAGAAFGLLGPLQFARALHHRFGWLHRAAGRVFVLSGMTLGLSGLALLAQVIPLSTPLIDVARAIFGLALISALAIGVTAAIDRDIPRHRAWMVRAYAIGMGSGTVALVFFPIYIVTGAPPSGLTSDVIFVAWWASNVGLAEWVVRRHSLARSRVFG